MKINLLSEVHKEGRVVNMSGRILLLFCVIIGIQTKAAPQFTLCNQDDSICVAKTSNIIYKQTIPGIPELNIEKLEPIYHDVIDGDLVGLKYKLYNTTVEGSQKCEVTNAKLELKKSKLNLEMICPLLNLYGFYEISGKILVVPIEGKGDYNMQCKGYHIQIDTELKIKQGKNGKKYMSLKNYKVNGDLQGGLTAEINNLFNGKQPELANNVNRFVNKNWKSVSKELQGPVFNANMKKLVKNFNKYLKSIPLNEIILDIDV